MKRDPEWKTGEMYYKVQTVTRRGETNGSRAVIYLKLRGAWWRDQGDREGGRSLRERVSSRGLVVKCLKAFPEGGEPRGEVQRQPTKEGS